MSGFKQMMEYRIRTGKSTLYPDRSVYYCLTEEYYFCNHTCTVYIVNNHKIMDLPEEIFQELLNGYWREEKNELRNTRDTYSYNNHLFVDSLEEEYIQTLPDPKKPASEIVYLRQLDKERLLNLLRSLSDLQATVLYRFFYEQKTEREIAKTLNRSTSTIHTAKIRGLRKLRELLTQEDDFLLE